MEANDSTPRCGESTSDVATADQQKLSRSFAAVWDGLRLSFLEAGKQIEEGDADAELVEELREEIEAATEAVDELEEFVDEREDDPNP